jgi:hypothetical protein
MEALKERSHSWENPLNVIEKTPVLLQYLMIEQRTRLYFLQGVMQNSLDLNPLLW